MTSNTFRNVWVINTGEGAQIESLPMSEKLQAAISYMRERGIYCLDKGSKPYTPANGIVPQPPIAQPTKLDTDCSYGGLGYLRRFDGYAA